MTLHDKLLLAGVVILFVQAIASTGILLVALRRMGFFHREKDEKPDKIYG